ncbi:MAG TPA: SgcJ/EcaC family oxidoreductase [Trebonia sp.]|jgi:uncharacterized protein (TIGR02246 family)|nr:SgcJ/EcaC family oxidoreductase [Trebonia sp.]
MFDETADRQAIATLARGMEDAWNRGDAAGYAAHFTADADFVAWNGTRGAGRQAIEAGHRPLFAGPLAGSRLVLAGEPGPGDPGARPSVRFVRPDVAIMVTAGAVTLPRERPAGPGHQSVQTFVVVKDDGRWQVAAFQNTREQPGT